MSQTMAGFLAQRINIEHMKVEANQVFSTTDSTLDQSDIITSFN